MIASVYFITNFNWNKYINEGFRSNKDYNISMKMTSLMQAKLICSLIYVGNEIPFLSESRHKHRISFNI